MRHQPLAVGGADLETELLLDEGEVQRVGAAVMLRHGEGVRLDDVVDGDGALVLLVRVAAPDGRLVERHRDQSGSLVRASRHAWPSAL